MTQKQASIRYSSDSRICIVDDGIGNFRMADQADMDNLPVGDDLTDSEIEFLDD